MACERGLIDIVTNLLWSILHFCVMKCCSAKGFQLIGSLI